MVESGSTQAETQGNTLRQSQERARVAAARLREIHPDSTERRGIFPEPPRLGEDSVRSENPPTLREGFDEKLIQFLRTQAQDPEGALALLEELTPLATEIQNHLQEDSAEHTLEDLLRLRNFYRAALRFRESRRLSNTDASRREISSLHASLSRTEAALHTLRDYLRSTVSDHPFLVNGEVQPRRVLSAEVRLQNSLLAARISMELVHDSGMTLDLRNWELVYRQVSESLTPEARIAQETALLRAWSRVRDAVTGLVSRDTASPPIPLRESEITERLQALRNRMLETVRQLGPSADEAEALSLFETRLNRAIDEFDSSFLSELSPLAIREFLQTARSALLLQAEIGGLEGQERFFRQIQAGSLYAQLGLGANVDEALRGAEEFLRGLAAPQEQLQGLLTLAQLHQSAGNRDEADRLFTQIAFIGENSSDPDLQDQATFARAMRRLNEGDLAQAESILESIPDHPAAQGLLTRLQAGMRRQRLAEVMGHWQAAAAQYLREMRSRGDATHLDRVERDLQLAFEEASRRVLAGEAENFSDALWSLDQGEHQGFLDTTSARELAGLSDLSLSDAAYHREILSAGRRLLDEECYGLAGFLAQSIRDRPDVGTEARHLLNHELQEALSNQQLLEQAHQLTYFVPYVNIPVMMHDIIAGPEGELGESFLNVGLAIAGLGVAVRAGVAAEGLITASRYTRALSPSALQLTGWAARSGTEAAVFSGFNLTTGALRLGSAEHLTLGNFSREFGAMLVTFGLLRGVGMPMARLSGPAGLRLAQAEQALAQAERAGVGIEAAGARLRTARWMSRGWQAAHWGSRVSAFTASEYLNEGIGLREETSTSLGHRLISSALMDAEMIAARRVLNALSRGGLEANERANQQRYAERALETARPRINRILEDLQRNALIEAGDPLSHYVEAALRQSVAQTGNTRAAEVFAGREGRRALFAAAEALGLEPGSRSYEMVTTALMVQGLEGAQGPGGVLRNLQNLGRQLSENSAGIHAVAETVVRSVGASAERDGTSMSEVRTRELHSRLVAQLADRVMRNQMGPQELREIEQGIRSGELRFFVQMDFVTGEFVWEFRRAEGRVEETIPSTAPSLPAGEEVAAAEEGETLPTRRHRTTRRRNRIRSLHPVAPARPAVHRSVESAERPTPAVRTFQGPYRLAAPRRGYPRRQENLPIHIDPGVLDFIRQNRGEPFAPLTSGLAMAAGSRINPIPPFGQIRAAGESDGGDRNSGGNPIVRSPEQEMARELVFRYLESSWNMEEGHQALWDSMGVWQQVRHLTTEDGEVLARRIFSRWNEAEESTNTLESQERTVIESNILSQLAIFNFRRSQASGEEPALALWILEQAKPFEFLGRTTSRNRDDDFFSGILGRYIIDPVLLFRAAANSPIDNYGVRRALEIRGVGFAHDQGFFGNRLSSLRELSITNKHYFHTIEPIRAVRSVHIQPAEGYDRILRPVEVPLREVVPAHFLADSGPGIHPEDINNIRRNIVARLLLQGWEEGTSPAATQLALAIMDFRFLPTVSQPDPLGRRLLLNGDSRIPALVSLVADGILPEEILERIPFRPVELDPEALIREWFAGVALPDPSLGIHWGTILGFDAASRQLAERQGLNQDLVVWIHEVLNSSRRSGPGGSGPGPLAALLAAGAGAATLLGSEVAHALTGPIADGGGIGSWLISAALGLGLMAMTLGRNRPGPEGEIGETLSNPEETLPNNLGDLQDLEATRIPLQERLAVVEQEVNRLTERLDSLSGRIEAEALAGYRREVAELTRRAEFWLEQQVLLESEPSGLRERFARDIEIGQGLLLDRTLRLMALIFAEPLATDGLSGRGLREPWRISPPRSGLDPERSPPAPGALPALINRDVGFGRRLGLRPHQEQALNAVRGWLASQRDRVESGEAVSPDFLQATILMPVGGGKTRTMVAAFAETMRQGLFDARRGDRLLLLNHTTQIHEQNREVLARLEHYFQRTFGRSLRVSEYKAEQRDLSGDVVVVSIPTVNNEARRESFARELREALGPSGRIAMVAVDEVHHLELGRSAGRGSWTQLLETLREVSPNFFRLGFTATPTGREARVLYRLRESELMRAGVTPRTYLVKVDGVDLSQLRVSQSSGDFAATELATTLLEHPARNRRILEALEARGLRRETPGPGGSEQLEGTIFFAADLAHARMLAQAYQGHFESSATSPFPLRGRRILSLGLDRGRISASELQGALRAYRAGEIDAVTAVVSGQTRIRDEILRSVEAGEIEAVFTVDALVEGADLFMFRNQVGARPTFSRIKRAQERGRINRRGPGETDARGRLLQDPPRILFDVIDRYVSTERVLVRYGDAMGLRGHVALPNGELYDALSESVVAEVDRSGSHALRLEAQDRALTRLQAAPPALADAESPWSPLVEILREILEGQYQGDLEQMAMDLGESTDFVTSLLEGRGWENNQWFLRRLSTLLYLERNQLLAAHQLHLEQRDPSIGMADLQILRGALRTYEAWEGSLIPGTGIRFSGDFPWGRREVEMSAYALAHLRSGRLSEGVWRGLWQGLSHYFLLQAESEAPARSSEARIQNQALLDHFFARHSWETNPQDPREQLRHSARRAVAGAFGGLLPRYPGIEGVPVQTSRANFNRWLAGDRIAFNPNNPPQTFYSQVRALLRGLGIPSETVEAHIQDAVFAERGWAAVATTPQEQLRLLARRGVAEAFGGVLPSRPGIEGVPVQNSDASLGRWLVGDEIVFSSMLPAQTFYSQVRALLGGLGIPSETVEAHIQDAVFAERGWAAVATTPQEQLRL
ncbi:MAG: DEAD/DEAH box helicase family protein, partial [Deltaproteobacteria bacterium]|nr:DEAD/DEAH box helicase family protein [Deltaproteobacteria bacterium]